MKGLWTDRVRCGFRRQQRLGQKAIVLRNLIRYNSSFLDTTFLADKTNTYCKFLVRYLFSCA